ncbi:hypothetical protein PybrP1_008639 [[Pythium] brassicae (nom. inval.)]|nr:hypothetical protein PybrP1_008639 [[Pythium] brassicae (nom. inval.)]
MLAAHPAATNNTIEYAGLVYRLRAAQDNQLLPLHVVGDSTLILWQMSLNRPPKSERLISLYQRARVLTDSVRAPQQDGGRISERCDWREGIRAEPVALIEHSAGRKERLAEKRHRSMDRRAGGGGGGGPTLGGGHLPLLLAPVDVVVVLKSDLSYLAPPPKVASAATAAVGGRLRRRPRLLHYVHSFGYQSITPER